MLIAVVSDTHVPHFARRFPLALERISAARPDRIVHCGDFTSLEIAPHFERIAPFDAVAGNNDGAEIVARFGRRKILEFGVFRVGVVHGDGERSTTLDRARAAFAHDDVHAIFFGHSHVPFCERLADRWLINPGSPTDKRRQPRFSFALVETSGAAFEPRVEFFDA